MTSKLHIYLPITVLLILFGVIYHPTVVKTAIGLSLVFVLTLTGGFFLIRRHLKTRWPFLGQIGILVLGALLFLLFLANPILRYVFIIIFSAILAVFLLNIHQLLERPRLYQPYSLEKMAEWLNFVIIYCFLGGLGALFNPDPFDSRFYLAAGIVFLLVLWLGSYLFWLKGYNKEGKSAFLLVISLIVAEIYLVINFLPFGFYLNALFTAIIFTIIVNAYVKRSKKNYH